jgi:hypothetical protein
VQKFERTIKPHNFVLQSFTTLPSYNTSFFGYTSTRTMPLSAFCREGGSSHSDIPIGKFCGLCGGQQDVRTPSTAPVRQGSVAAPIAIDESPIPQASKQAVFIPQSQNQPLSKVELPPTRLDADAVHARTTALLTRKQSILSRHHRTNNQQKGLPTGQLDTKSASVRVEIQLLVVQYVVPAGSDEQEFYNSRNIRTYYIRDIISRLIIG